MRRFVLTLLVLFLLCGCANRAPVEASSVETTTEEMVTVPPDVISWEIPAGSYYDLQQMGANLALFSLESSRTRITLISPEDGTILSSALLSEDLSGQIGTIQLSTMGICYFSPQDACLVFLDLSCGEVRRMYAPHPTNGVIVIQPDWKTACYMADSTLISMDIETGISAQIEVLPDVTLAGSIYNGSVLVLRAQDDSILFYSVQDRRLLDLPGEGTALVSDEHCCIRRWEDTLLIFPAEDPVWVCDSKTPVYPLSDLDQLVTVTEDQKGLFFWRMQDGASAGYYAPDSEAICSPVIWSRQSERLFFCAKQGKNLMLYGVKESMLKDAAEDSLYLPYYAPDVPDTEGLTACQQMLDDLSAQFGISIILGDPVFSRLSGGHTFTEEYLGDRAMEAAGTLASLLSSLPNGFLQEIAGGTTDNTLHIGLFRDIVCKEGMDCPGISLRQDGKSYLALSMEHLTDSLWHALGHVVAGRVREACNLIDDWSSWNPRGFSYPNADWEGDGFVSQLGTLSMLEDWAETFRCAMTGYDFSDEICQKKLSRLCKGIRKAFQYKDPDLLLPWESGLMP